MMDVINSLTKYMNKTHNY